MAELIVLFVPFADKSVSACAVSRTVFRQVFVIPVIQAVEDFFFGVAFLVRFHIGNGFVGNHAVMPEFFKVFVIIAAVIDQPVHALVHFVIADRCQMTAHGFAELLRVFHGIADIGEYQIVVSLIFDRFFRNKGAGCILCVINRVDRFGNIIIVYDLCH